MKNLANKGFLAYYALASTVFLASCTPEGQVSNTSVKTEISPGIFAKKVDISNGSGGLYHVFYLADRNDKPLCGDLSTTYPVGKTQETSATFVSTVTEEHNGIKHPVEGSYTISCNSLDDCQKSLDKLKTQ